MGNYFCCGLRGEEETAIYTRPYQSAQSSSSTGGKHGGPDLPYPPDVPKVEDTSTSPSKQPRKAFANTRCNAEELLAAVKSWTRPYTEGPLTESELTQFFEKGWVIKKNLLPEELVTDAIDGVNGLVDVIAQRLKKAGRIDDACEGAGFHERLIALDKKFPHANVLLHKYGKLPVSFQRLWASEALLGVARQVLGQDADIDGHPVWNIRCKTPESLSQGQATVPWHQDNGYLDEESWDKLQLTAWVPLVHATEANGCMQVVSGAHRTGLTAVHTCCVGGTWYNDLPEQEIKDVLGVDPATETVTCEVPLGGVLFLNNTLPHRSLPNNTNDIRWSLDLRWQRAGEPNGFSGIKDSIPMVRPKDSSFTIDWTQWANENRITAMADAASEDVRRQVGEAAKSEGLESVVNGDPAEFDTTISGPWMNRWELVHHNRHTAALQKPGATAKDKA